MTFCIPRSIANTLLNAAKKGEFTMNSLYDMKPAERRSLFEKYTDKDMAVQMNAAFDKAKLSEQQDALKKWAEKAFKGQKKKTDAYGDIVRKIESLEELGVLDPKTADNYMEDLVSTELGLTITPNEVYELHKRAKRLQEVADQESEFGTPTLEYFRRRRDVENYIDSLTPSSRLRVTTQTIGRGNLLTSFKSAFLNIESTTVQGFITAVERRIETRRFKGANGDYAKRFREFNNQVYKETGYDTTRMFGLERRVRGESIGTSQGEGTIRRVGRFFEDKVFRGLMGRPDVFFASFAFADRVDLASSKIAQGEGLKGKALKTRALEISKDATRIDPKTQEGAEVRASAMADATQSTFTNKGAAARLALGVRNIFNLATGDFRLGDMVMPFVKTPASVIQAGVERSGVNIAPETAVAIGKTIANFKQKGLKESFGDSFDGYSQKVIKAGLGMTFAYLVASLFEPDEFIGEYPTSQKEQELLRLNQATTNSVKIGGRWWHLDYFGPLAAPIVGFLQARKYGDTFPEKVWEYHMGVFAQVKRLPGLDEFKDIVEEIENLGTSRQQDFKDRKADVSNFLVNFISSRSIPAIISDTARGIDDTQRDTTGGRDMLFSKIPFLRETLPEKTNIFGEPIPEQGLISTWLFGQRVKVANEDGVVQELNRLAEKDSLPSITDVEKTSPRAKELKNQIGDEAFRDAKNEFGQELYKKFEKEMKRSSYQRATDEEKKKKLESIKGKEFERMLKRSKYKKPKK